MTNIASAFDGMMDSVKAGLSAAVKPLGSVLGIFSDFRAGAVLILAVFAVFFVINLLRDKGKFAQTMHNPRTLAICSMLIAVNVALGYLTLDLSSYLRIGFGFVTLPVAGMLFGPLAACVTGILQDLVSFVLRPTGAYLFTLTVNVGISGMIYGAMLYKKPISFWRVFVTKLLIIVVINIILNSAALAPTVGSGLVGILPSRIIKNIILLPIQSVIVYIILKTAETRLARRMGV